MRCYHVDISCCQYIGFLTVRRNTQEGLLTAASKAVGSTHEADLELGDHVSCVDRCYPLWQVLNMRGGLFVSKTEVDNRNVDCQYDLYGVIVHQGETPDSGHYYAYVKHKEQWFCLNDEVVTKVESSQIRNESVETEAYILFYSRSDGMENLCESGGARWTRGTGGAEGGRGELGMKRGWGEGRGGGGEGGGGTGGVGGVGEVHLDGSAEKHPVIPSPGGGAPDGEREGTVRWVLKLGMDWSILEEFEDKDKGSFLQLVPKP
jgi:hypothetical protein